MNDSAPERRIDRSLTHSLGLMVVGSLLVSSIDMAGLPQTWQDNALAANPGEPINPACMDCVITSAASLFGLGLGFFWLNARDGFSAI